MKRAIKITFLLLFLTTNWIYAQTDPGKDTEKLKKGQEILNQARKAIDKGNVLDNLKSFYVNIDNSLPAGNYNGKEVSIVMPDKIREVSDLGNFKVFRIVNGGKYSEDSQMTLGGEIMPSLRQMGGQPPKPNIPSYIEEVLPKERLEYLKKNPDELNKLMLEAGFWSDIFPILLTNPLNTNVKYEYVGKAESAKQRADIVDVKSNFYRKIRLIFDENTHLLLMMTFELDLAKLTTIQKYYFSNYQLTDGLLVAKTIKQEGEEVFKDGSEKKTYNPPSPVIKEIKINSNQKANLFSF
jgi:hypothetical protein